MKEINGLRELKKFVNQEKPVVLDFYAKWCGPCQALIPTLERVEEDHKEDVAFGKVNIDLNGDLATLFKVRSIPSVFYIDKGQIRKNELGNQSEEAIVANIEDLLKNRETAPV